MADNPYSKERGVKKSNVRTVTRDDGARFQEWKETATRDDGAKVTFDRIRQISAPRSSRRSSRD